MQKEDTEEASNSRTDENGVSSAVAIPMESSSSSPVYYQNRSSSSSADLMRGLCGLQNLGNTCFMNSAIQCLSNVPELTNYFLEDKYVDEINASNPLGTGGHLVKDYAELLKDMWSGQCSSVRPHLFKQTIGRFAPRFTGHAQHDSQELTAFLLDGLHEDLNRVKQKPYVEEKEMTGQNEVEAAKQSWDDYRKRNDSIIVDLLHGQHKSTLTCNVCSKISIKFEPFGFLSVPVPTKEHKVHSTVIFMRVEKWAKFYITHTSKTTVGQLKQTLREQLQLPSSTELIIFSTSSARMLKDNSTWASSQVYSFNAKLYVYAPEPGPIILVESNFGIACPPVFLPRPAKLTRRTVLDELVPRVRELCLPSSPWITTSYGTGGGSTTSSAPASSSSSCTALVPFPSSTVATISASASSSMSPSTSLSMSSSSSSTLTPAMPPPAVSSCSSSVSSTLSPPPPSSLLPTAGGEANRLSGGAAGGVDGGGSSPARGGTAAAESAALPSSSQSSPATGGHHMVTFANGDDALDNVVASPLTPASVATNEPADDVGSPPPQHHENDEFETMMDTTDNDEQEEQQHQSQQQTEEKTTPPTTTTTMAPPVLPMPISIDLLIKETWEKIPFPEDMDEELLPQLADNEMEEEKETEETDEKEPPESSIVVKLHWPSSLRSRFDSTDINMLVDREVNMTNNMKKCYTLKECIDMYTQQEQLNEEDSWYCPHCKTHQRAFKKLDLWTLPQILVIHLKRFIYSRYTRDKIETELEIPIRGLDLSDKVLNPEHSQEKYDLIGISNHLGGLGSGHYTACALNGTDWCEFNDSSAFRMNRDVPDVFISREAYMLFYRRRETPPPPSPQEQKQAQQQQQQ